MMAAPLFVRRTARRILVAGLLAGLVGWLIGWAVETARFGRDPGAVRARLEADVTGEFAALADRLDVAVRAASVGADLLRAAEQNDDRAARILFDRADAAAHTGGPGVAVSVYGPRRQVLAWTGASANVPGVRLTGRPSLFVTTNALGLQLARVEPLVDPSAAGRAIGAVVAQVALGGEAPPGFPGVLALRTRLGVVHVRPAEPAESGARGDAFVVRARTGEELAIVTVPPGALEAARRRVGDVRLGALVALGAIVTLLLVGPMLDWRAAARSIPSVACLTLAIAGLLVFARALLWVAVRRLDLARPALIASGSWSDVPALMLASPVDFCLTSLLALGLVGLGASSFARWRAARRPGIGVLPVDRPSAAVLFWTVQVSGAACVAAILAAYASFFGRYVAQAPVDILRFGVDFQEPVRLLVVVGLLALNAAVFTALVLVLRLAAAPWVFPASPRRWRRRAAMVWAAPALLALVPDLRAQAPLVPASLATLCVAWAAWGTDRWRTRVRRASQAARLLAWFVALALPSLVFYPALVEAAQRARRQIVESRYAPEVIHQRRNLQVRLREALIDIDRLDLGALVSGAVPEAGMLATDAAFQVWSQTNLADLRLTSSVELHNAAGEMVSRFALKLPDTPQQWTESSCDWEILEEVNPFFAEERRLLHAGRGICEAGTRRQRGSIVVHAMLDYGNLSFVSAENPSLALLRSGRPQLEPRLRPVVEFAVYGWSRRVLYSSGPPAGPLPETVYQAALETRQPFWATVGREGGRLDVYVLNDRAAIYVLGMPRRTLVDHLVTLAELLTLAFAVFAVLAAGSLVFGLVLVRAPTSGRALLAEVRASFYRKLFLAFVAAGVVPVLAMALVAREYVAALMLADIESEASRTAALASRVVEDFASTQAGGVEPQSVVDDNLAVWLSRVIAQDVNIFDGATLLASSERNLFASGLLAERTPGDVFRAIRIEGRASYVGRDVTGSLTYLVAAAPVRLRDRDAVLTVPLASRQQEVEAQIAELDRRVVLAALLFIMTGAALGYYMAERIADPVNRLMRATQRIARGEFDVRVLTTSADELRRLVDAFNRMAEDLLRQRRELERTNRLQAWADMARQVAHDIKNPLTPIQLNVEHLLRVHADRGRPLGDVFDACAANILGQVRLLRQIAGEFSSFAASPEPKPAAVGLADLVTEVIGPYRTALAGRVTFATVLPADLPPVKVDRVLMGRALTNVVENALHAMPNGGTLTLTADPVDGGFIALHVTDTGVGMDDDALARIFEPYFSTKTSGTGLGLTIARRNVEAVGGSIRVTSAPGCGTTVTMLLPRA